jgi:uncharacterized Zn finger protein (UPF0148 family)
MLAAECPHCGVTFNTDQEEGLITCEICGLWFYAYEDEEESNDE